MGTSTDWILCYGIALEDESVEHYHVKEIIEAYDELYQKHCKNIVYHCSNDCMMFIIAAAESKHKARRGFQKELGQLINSDPKWESELREVCESLGVEYRQPQWLLCSYWG